MDDSDLMKREWDERARKKPFTYIASWREDWDEASFFESGQADFEQFVTPVLQILGLDLKGKTVLEVGAGVGRMTQAFAKASGKVVAVDISEEMLLQGKSFLADQSNIVWIQDDATKLSNVPTASVDLGFSYTVFHHMPAPGLVMASIKEMMRCISPNGAFLFHFLSDLPEQPVQEPAGMIARLMDLLRPGSAGPPEESPPVEADPQKDSQTWRGSRVDVKDVLEMVWASGGSVAGVTGWGTDRTWCYGTKLPAEQE